MTKIEIMVFKDTGKYYTSAVVESETAFHLWDDAFAEFVRNNLPAKIGDGYVVVKDVEPGEGFHCRLYRYHELFKNV